ncbi:MAG: hypothetical protein FK733_09380 [Asgard group archaeon]|nr:hypothetical protein [Asgard group archaeon]
MADELALAINILLATYALISTIIFFFTWRRRPDLIFWFIALIVFTIGHILLIFKHFTGDYSLIFVYIGNTAQVIALLFVVIPTFYEYHKLMIKEQEDYDKTKREILIFIFAISISVLLCAIAAIILDAKLFLDILSVIVLVMIILLMPLTFFVLRIYLVRKTITRMFMFVTFLAGTITAISTITAIHAEWGTGLNYALNFIFMSFILTGGLAAPIERRITDSEEKYKLLSENLEEKVEERTLQLERMYEELEAYSYSVSHDLKAPLRAIAGFSKALGESISEKLTENEIDYLNRIASSTERMNELINDLLELAQISREDVNLETVNLSSMADEILKEMTKLNPKRDIEFEVERGITAKCDIKLIRIVLENLFSNALKFSATKPKTKITFGKIEREEKIQFFVKDYGVGFDMKYYEKLFGLFQRLHSSDEFEGTGVGLITVKRIIDRHNGEIWAESKKGEGTTFYFTLN